MRILGISAYSPALFAWGCLFVIITDEVASCEESGVLVDLLAGEAHRR